MEPLNAVNLIIAIVLALFAIPKNIIDLWATPRATQRADYNFAHDLAQRTNDADTKSYAEELGYRALVNDENLNILQRKALLKLPNRVKWIPRYMKVRKLLTVNAGGPILTWKALRHGNAVYRGALIVMLFIAYVVCASVGLAAILISDGTVSNPFFASISSLSVWGSIYLIIFALLCLRRSMQFDIAAKLVKVAASGGTSANGPG